MEVSYEWIAIAPEFMVLMTALLLFMLEWLPPVPALRRLLPWVGAAGIFSALLASAVLWQLETISLWKDAFRLDSFAKAFKLLFMMGTAFTILLAGSWQIKQDRPIRGMYPLMVTGLLGAMIMITSGDLLFIFAGLELLSLSILLLQGFGRRAADSVSIAVRGAAAAAAVLFGISYLYGLSGTTNLKQLSVIMKETDDSGTLYLYAVVFFLLLAALFFKFAFLPIYRRSVFPAAAFFAAVGKTAGMAVMLRLLLSLYMEVSGDKTGAFSFFEWYGGSISVLACAAVIAGTAGVWLNQKLKDMLLWAGCAQSGWLLAAFASLGGGYFLYDSYWYYALADLFLTIGLFAVLYASGEDLDQAERPQLGGLYNRSPFLGISMAVLLLGAAGIPGTGGFIARIQVLTGTYAREPVLFTAPAVLAVSAVWMLGIFLPLAASLFRQGEESDRKSFSASAGAAGLCASAVVILGFFPALPLDFLHGEFGSFLDFLNG